MIDHDKNFIPNIKSNANTVQYSKVKRKMEHGTNLLKNLFWLHFKQNIL